MKFIISFFFLFLIFTVSDSILAQNSPSANGINISDGKLGRYTREHWRSIIDSTWGEGLPTSTKLEIFDTFWNTIDREFAGFQHLDIDWDSLRAIYRPEVDSGVSRGRFSGIMNYLTLRLKEIHTFARDDDIFTGEFTGEFNLYPGIPILIVTGAGWTGHFGAGLTPLPDSSLLVYQVVDDHPLGLEVGDIVLGYDGSLWKHLYKELLDFQLPIASSARWGSSERSFTHSMLNSAGMNWHLFDTLDLVKYSSGDTIHLSVDSLEGKSMKLFSTESIPIPGIIPPDFLNGERVSWGIVDGTQIGYIYVLSWNNTGQAFSNAVDSLMNKFETSGLIIDYRLNSGGQVTEADEGYKKLFNNKIPTLVVARRSDPNDHLAMKLTGSRSSNLQNSDGDLYDRPLAILTGPMAASAGDQHAIRIKFHPMARIFGKPTNTAFIRGWLPLSMPTGWTAAYAWSNTFLSTDSGNYLIHRGFEVDEEVWLTREDVVKGEDTVVKRAIDWINNLVHGHTVTVDPVYAVADVDEVFISSIVYNPKGDSVSVSIYIEAIDGAFIDSIPMFNDGVHNDGSAGDSLWANSWMPRGEHTFQINLKTTDEDSGISRILPNANRFTTIGPVAYDTLNIVLESGSVIGINLNLRNEGLTAPAISVNAEISSADSCVSSIINSHQSFGTIGAGESVSGNANIGILLNPNCSGEFQFPFEISIESEGFEYWTDNFALNVTVGVEDDVAGLPIEYSLSNAYPNPFNPTTRIEYALPKAGDVSLTIYNLLGEEVIRLINGSQNVGYHSVTWDASNVSSGIYFYRLQAGDFVQTRKMVLLK